MTTQILTIGKIMNKEDIDKRIMATRGQAKEECKMALKRLNKEYEEIKKSPTDNTVKYDLKKTL